MCQRVMSVRLRRLETPLTAHAQLPGLAPLPRPWAALLPPEHLTLTTLRRGRMLQKKRSLQKLVKMVYIYI